MNRPVISPAFCRSSSPDHTLEVMQKRIQMAEEETKKLVDQLSDYGFTKDKHEQKESVTNRIEPISPFKPNLLDSPQVEALQKNYERMVTRVCRAESTIQSLKLAMCSLQAERELTSLNQEKHVSIPKDTYDKEIKTLEKELARCRKELGDVSLERDELKENFSRVNSTLEKTSVFNAEAKAKLEESKSIKQKLTKKVNELKEELSHETELRSSLENSHKSLLSRVNDMENLVETERNEVQKLGIECDGLKKESVMAKQEYNKEHRLRMQLETLVSQLQEDSTNADANLATLTAYKKNMEAEISIYKRDNKELRQQFESLRSNYENLKVAHEKMVVEHKKSSEELHAVSVDNKVLISQQKDIIEKERQCMVIKLTEKDKSLEEARKQLVREAEEGRQRLQFAEQERINLKHEINMLNEQLQDERNKSHLSRKESELKLDQLQVKIGAVAREKEDVLKEKTQILDEIEQTVNGFTQERDRIVKQLNDAHDEIEHLQQKKNALERENQKQLDKILELQSHQQSQQQIEDAMKEIIESKNKLAYDKGTLQSKVDHLQRDVSSLNNFKMEVDQLKRENVGIQNSYNKVSSELQSSRLQVQSLQGQLREAQMQGARKDEELRAVMESREEALREVEKLVHHAENMERNNRHKVEAIQKSFNEARDNNNRLSSTMDSLMASHNELQMTLEKMQTELGRRDAELQSTIREKNSSLEMVKSLQHEIRNLQNKLDGLENNEIRELRPLRGALKSAKDEIQDLTEKLERALKNNKKLQNTAEVLQMELGRKDVELEKLLKEREHGVRETHLEVAELQDRLAEVADKARHDMQEVKAKNKKETAKLKKELEEAISVCSHLRDEKLQLEDQVKQQEQELEKARSKSKNLKQQLNQAKKDSQSKGKEEELAKTKTENIKAELNRLEKVKTEYVRKNKEQAKTIEEFVSKVSDLKHELRALIEAQKKTLSECKEKEKEVDRERNLRKNLEKHLKEAQTREKELDSVRKETEQKLVDANNESQQVTESLKQAHKWFKNKFEDLQAELARSKKLQTVLERENREQQRKLKEERKQVDEQTEKAREVLRASRMAVSQLSSEVTENYWETKGMKHALQAERDYSDLTTLKLQRLQDSTARHMEDLAQEVDRLRRSAR